MEGEGVLTCGEETSDMGAISWFVKDLKEKTSRTERRFCQISFSHARAVIWRK